MAFLNDAVMDAALGHVADNGTRIDLCSQEPTSYAEATSTHTLANNTLTAGDGNGDYTIGDGDTSGRKLTLAEQQIASASGTGTATHWAITDGSSTLLATGALDSSQAITSGNPVTINSQNIYEIRDPS